MGISFAEWVAMNDEDFEIEAGVLKLVIRLEDGNLVR
jgi:hypothetical protein